ncbi:MAG: hypothetical protein CMF31_09220 [Kordiimonas sp.]|nr:hypothetical protein [Kordiimonas sp.]|tara:strand:- start:614 stop:853 length:240 start_codon:yes stop_codon:yes gene_type:complete
MANDLDNNDQNRLSLRHSVLVWVAGAVLGWVVAVVSVYSALRVPENEFAETDQLIAPETDLAADPAELDKIMPAAGENK